MSTAPEMKYSDRDLRDDPSLMELAVAYILAYTGEFEPLVEAKEMYEEEGYLTIPVARKVLNCMRHDARVAAELPPPARQSGIVLPFQAPRRPRIKYSNKQCDTSESHRPHRWGEQNEISCDGVPFAINRDAVWLPVKIKPEFAAARTGILIHEVAPDGAHQGIWRGPAHSWGFRSQEYPYHSADADLHAKMRCKNPSWILNPILIRRDQLDQFKTIEDVLTGIREMKMCPRCIAARSAG